jgi:formylglycine-generating enzyme required for sulfatase activity
MGCTHDAVSADCNDGWCKIPAGCFIMGSPESEWGHTDYETQRMVTLTHSFVIGEHEVSNAEWKSLGYPLAPLRPTDYASCLDDSCPVASVTWYESLAYANALSQREGFQQCFDLSGCTGSPGVGGPGAEAGGTTCPNFIQLTTPTLYECKGYRLPTAAEWEYSIRAGTLTAFYSGDIVPQRDTSGVCAPDPNAEAIGWYCQNSGNTSHPCGQKWPNAWGLSDMAGNVQEMVFDGLHDSDLDPSPTTINPLGKVVDASPTHDRRTRGGGFYTWSDQMRSANMLSTGTTFRSSGTGFRLVRSID